MSYNMHQSESGVPITDTSEQKLDIMQKAAHVEEMDSDSEGQYDIDPVIDKRVTLKFDLHIVPWLFGIW